LERRATLLLVVFALAVVGLLPLLAMLGKSLFVDGQWTLSVYERLFSDPAQYWAPIRNSLTLAASTAGCAVLLGVPLGLLLAKTDLPLRKPVTVMLCVPLVLPPYVLAICWFNVLSNFSWLSAAAASKSGLAPSNWLFGLPGCVLVLVSALMPAVIVLTAVYLHAVNPRHEEAGRLIAGWRVVLTDITLPIISRGILFAGLLVFLLALGEVGVPMYLRYPVFAVETLTQFSAFYDFGAAAAAATPLLAVTLLLLAAERRYLRGRTYALLAATWGRQMLLIPLGRWRVPAALAAILFTSLTVVLPLASVVVSSLSPFAYPEALSKAAGSVARSIIFASIGATLLTLFGFFCGYLIHTRALALWRAVDTLTLLLFTLPGTVIGIGLITLWNRPGMAWLYASAAMVILGYIAQYIALASRITVATLANVPQSLEESAQMAGAPWQARIWHIIVPVALPGLIAAWMVSFIFCMRDLGASVLVYPAGADTLPVRIFTSMANGAPSLIAALCVILVAATVIPLGIFVVLLRTVRSRP
jgi:iron(III) transport system permease protein